jgi:hypothetical protein
MAKILLIIFSAVSAVHAFVARSPVLVATAPQLVQQLHMAPKFENGKWVATQPDDQPEAGYPPFQTLIMHGPGPWFTRTFNPDDYEQAVLKFMASDKVSRTEAQGNMDAYLRNPADWTYNRMESEKRGTKIDYATVNPKETAKVLVWAGIVFFFFGRIGIVLASGADVNNMEFWSFLG